MNRLKQFRKERGLKAADVCKAVDCNYQQLMRWEAGGFVPVDKVRLLASLYNIPFIDLIDIVYPEKVAS